jgi:hypothetical protein
MFSQLTARSTKQLTALSTMGFRASAVTAASKKPSIGDAVTILQSKVSQINQVVSNLPKIFPRYLSSQTEEGCAISFNLISE